MVSVLATLGIGEVIVVDDDAHDNTAAQVLEFSETAPVHVDLTSQKMWTRAQHATRACNQQN